MSTFASQTRVASDRSISEIERTLRRYGASSFVYGTHEGKVVVIFELHGRRIRFTTPLPMLDEFKQTETGRTRRSRDIIESAWEQAIRSRYRALLLSIKGKLESAESEIESFEDAFMAQTVMPNGKTMSEWAAPQITTAYESGKMPPLMIASPDEH